MKDLDTYLDADTAKLEGEGAYDLMSGDFDPACVFADPVSYLDGLGLRSELLETRQRGFPAAA